MGPNAVDSFRKARYGPALYDRGGIFMAQPGASPVPSSVDRHASQKTVSRFKSTISLPLSSKEGQETCSQEHAFCFPFWESSQCNRPFFLIYLG